MVAVDGTGVGAPVVDLLRAARLGCEVAAVTITGGERVVRNGQAWNVPKRDLIAGVQVLLEQGDLRIAAGLAEAGALVRELLDVRITMAGGGRVRFVIDDDGPGIPDDQLERVFARFHRTDSGRTRAGGGTGLGLAIVRAIADAHGGSVTASSAPEGGARFVLDLPGFTPAAPAGTPVQRAAAEPVTTV